MHISVTRKQDFPLTLAIGLAVIVFLLPAEETLVTRSISIVAVTLTMWTVCRSFPAAIKLFAIGSAAIAVILFVYPLHQYLLPVISTAALALWISIHPSILKPGSSIGKSVYKAEGHSDSLLPNQDNESLRQELEEAQAKILLYIARNQALEHALIKSERIAEAVVKNFPDGVVYILNKDLSYILADGSDAIEFQLPGRAHATLSSIDALYPELNLNDQLTKAFTGETIRFEFVIKNKTYTVTGLPIEDSNKEIQEVIVLVRNITEQKVLENNLIKALEKEREFNALKSRFVTVATHEFRTPLSTILSSVFLLENSVGTEYETEKGNYFDKIKRAVHNLTGLLNDFLSIGKLEEGKIKVAYADTEIKSFFDEFLEEVSFLKKVNQTINYVYNGTDCILTTDKLLLKNILINLLSNAIKYSSAEAEIQFTVEQKKDNLRILVSDQGIGIPDHEQHQIFKRFYRGQNAYNVEGTGLGLNIVRKYVRLLRGKIEFTSQLNKGTTFIVNIPVSIVLEK